LRDRLGEIRARGAELVIVGNGAESFAKAFREDFSLDGPLLVDPELRAYRAAGLRRGRVEVLSPRLPLHALRALRSGARQTQVQGDPWQLGGVFVIRPGGELAYRYVSREAGDHPPLDAILEALEKDAPALDEAPPRSPIQAWLGRALGRVVDPFILGSFDRTGFRIHSLRFDPADLDVDLAGRRCLVTGANSGIGYETALALADLGAEVVLLCRDGARGEAAAARIRERTGNPRVRLEILDVSDLAAVRAAGRRLAEGPVDVLIHNAGVLPDARLETRDGLELTLATHVVGPFLLTSLLRQRLEASPDGRVVWVSSGGMYARKLALDDPNWERRDYDGVLAYAETKRAQVVLAELWAEELAGSSVAVNSMHPGWADTPAVKDSLPRFHSLTRRILRTPAEGADTVVWLAASSAARALRGRFVFDREARRTHLLPFTKESQRERRELWRLCLRRAGVREVSQPRTRRGARAAGRGAPTSDRVAGGDPTREPPGA
jgi:NAD(P)-dependent dehydrogenase (short-subunit alcohol dehydrogenase family)